LLFLCRVTARGAVLLEDARIDPATRDLARACAALLALRSSEQACADAAVPAAPAAPRRAEQAMEACGLAETALAPGEPAPAGGPTTRAAVLVLRLADAASSHRDVTPAADIDPPMLRLARAVEEAVAAHGVPYARMVGRTVVAAAGLAEQSDAALANAASRLADVALALRDRCPILFTQEEDTLCFGLDVGALQAGCLGHDAAIPNLWGEALRGAEMLAETAPAGTIQASEQAYLRLRQSFVFRPRGVFHRPGLGDAACYVLAGRA